MELTRGAHSAICSEILSTAEPNSSQTDALIMTRRVILLNHKHPERATMTVYLIADVDAAGTIPYLTKPE